jgi:hypothetical protein
MTERFKDLNYEERATWGECPVCEAPDGAPCLNTPEPGKEKPDPHSHTLRVHFDRLRAAPTRVRIVAEPKEKSGFAMPTVSITPNARAALDHEWTANAYSHPEDGADGGMYLDLHCIGADVVVSFNDFER